MNLINWESSLSALWYRTHIIAYTLPEDSTVQTTIWASCLLTKVKLLTIFVFDWRFRFSRIHFGNMFHKQSTNQTCCTISGAHTTFLIFSEYYTIHSSSMRTRQLGPCSQANITVQLLGWCWRYTPCTASIQIFISLRFCEGREFLLRSFHHENCLVQIQKHFGLLLKMHSLWDHGNFCSWRRVD